jgi:hypothetical protein
MSPQVSTDALVARLARVHDLPFSGAVDYLCRQNNLDPRGEVAVLHLDSEDIGYSFALDKPALGASPKPALGAKWPDEVRTEALRRIDAGNDEGHVTREPKEDQ